jgi:hypothetical protein
MDTIALPSSRRPAAPQWGCAVDEAEDLLPLARRLDGVGGEVERSTRTRKRSVDGNATDMAKRRGVGQSLR